MVTGEGILIPGVPFPVGVWTDKCRSEFHTKFAPDASRDLLYVRFEENSIFTLCLGCRVMFTLHPQGLEVPDWMEMYEDKRKRNFVTATMMKHQKKKMCLLCGSEVARIVEDLGLCKDHASAYERKVLDGEGSSPEISEG